MSDQAKVQEPETKKVSRRNVLKAAVAAGGAAVLGFPNIVKAQGVTTMRWQSTWPQKDIFHEFALDFAKKVVDMTGGDLKIEVLPAGRGGASLRRARCRVEGYPRRRLMACSPTITARATRSRSGDRVPLTAWTPT